MGYEHRVHTECQWLLSGVHSITMEKLVQPGAGGGCTPTPFYYIYTSRTILRCNTVLRLRGQIHFPYFYSTPNMYSAGTGWRGVKLIIWVK
jgi:hypothetical protein